MSHFVTAAQQVFLLPHSSRVSDLLLISDLISVEFHLFSQCLVGRLAKLICP